MEINNSHNSDPEKQTNPKWRIRIKNFYSKTRNKLIETIQKLFSKFWKHNKTFFETIKGSRSINRCLNLFCIFLLVIVMFLVGFRQNRNSSANILDQKTVIINHNMKQILEDKIEMVDNEIDTSIKLLKNLVDTYNNITNSLTGRRFRYYANTGSRWDTKNHFNDLEEEIKLIKSLLLYIKEEFKQALADVEDEHSTLYSLNKMIKNITTIRSGYSIDSLDSRLTDLGLNFSNHEQPLTVLAHTLNFPFTNLKTIYMRNSFKNNAELINYIKINQTVFNVFTIYKTEINEVALKEELDTINQITSSISIFNNNFMDKILNSTPIEKNSMNYPLNDSQTNKQQNKNRQQVQKRKDVYTLADLPPYQDSTTAADDFTFIEYENSVSQPKPEKLRVKNYENHFD